MKHEIKDILIKTFYFLVAFTAWGGIFLSILIFFTSGKGYSLPLLLLILPSCVAAYKSFTALNSFEEMQLEN